MQDYKPNSNRFKEEQRGATREEKRVTKPVTTSAKTKKNEVRKFTDIFISEDVSNVKSYIFMDVLVPAIKKAISDIVTDGIDMILYGGSGGGRKKSSSAPNISYSGYYDKRDRSEPRATRGRFKYDDISVDYRGEAEEILERMEEIIDTYDEVSVADMYDLAGLTAPHTANKYGWTNLRNAKVVRTRDGYVLDLPKALPLD